MLLSLGPVDSPYFPLATLPAAAYDASLWEHKIICFSDGLRGRVADGRRAVGGATGPLA